MLLLLVVLFHQNSLDTDELAETATQSVGLSPENEPASQLIALALINPRTRQRRIRHSQHHELRVYPSFLVACPLRRGQL